MANPKQAADKALRTPYVHSRWLAGLAVMVSLTHLPAAPGDVDPSFSSDASLDYVVLALAPQPDGKALIGGAFSTVQGVSRSSIARLNSNGSLDPNFLNGLTGANDSVWCLALQSNGKVVIGGFFSSVNGATRHAIARLNADGTVDNGFLNGLDGANGAVYAAAVQSDGKIVIGGDFTSVNGSQLNYVARLNADGTVDSSFLNGQSGANYAVFSLAIQTNGQILVGGWFTMLDGTPRNHLARLNTDGSLDPGFLNGLSAADGRVWAIAVQADGKVLVGGDFATINDVSRNRLARLNGDGSLDNAFLNGQAGANDSVWSLGLAADGKIIAGGQFTAMCGTNRNGIARLNQDGTLDSTFLNGMAGCDNAVRTLALQSDGKILIGGQFNHVNLQVNNYIARLLAGSPPPVMQNTRVVNGHFTFNISGVFGQTAVVQASTDLRTWTPIATNTLSSSPTPFTDPRSATSGLQLYRVLTPSN